LRVRDVNWGLIQREEVGIYAVKTTGAWGGGCRLVWKAKKMGPPRRDAIGGTGQKKKDWEESTFRQKT